MTPGIKRALNPLINIGHVPPGPWLKGSEKAQVPTALDESAVHVVGIVTIMHTDAVGTAYRRAMQALRDIYFSGGCCPPTEAFIESARPAADAWEPLWIHWR